MFVKILGKKIESNRSITNLLRNKFKTVEVAYLLEHGMDAPKCKYCGFKCMFISFFKGYLDRCNSNECIHRSVVDSNKMLGKKRVLNKLNKDSDFYKYIIQNSNFYINNFKKINIIEPFTGIRTGKLTLRSFLRRRISKECFYTYKDCIYCNSSFLTDIFINRKYCHNSKCVEKARRKYIISSKQFTPQEINNLYQVFRIDGISHVDAMTKIRTEYTSDYVLINKIYKYYDDYSILKIKYLTCPVTGFIIPLRSRSNILKKHCFIHNIDINSYIEKYFPNFISRCLLCADFSEVKSDLIKETHKKFCNRDHYLQYKKINPDKYRCSDDQKNKQSKIIKNLILSGKFTPKTQNRFTHFEQKIVINNIEYKFRSSWEAAFFVSNNINYEKSYEKLRILYRDKLGKSHIYISDFYLPNTNTLYELKPRNLYKIQKYKMNEVIKYCKTNNIKFIWINEDNLLNFLNIEIVKNYPTIFDKIKGIIK